MGWKEDLIEKLKTPEQKQAERAAEDAKSTATARKTVVQALAVARRTLLEAQPILAAKYGPLVVEQNGDDSTLRFGAHTISAAASEDGTRLIIKDDDHEMTLSGRDIMDIRELVGRLIQKKA